MKTSRFPKRFVRILSALISIVGSTSAMAQSQLDFHTLRTVGKGAASKTSSEILVLACVNQEGTASDASHCDFLRSVLIQSQSSQAQFIGRVFPVLSQDSELGTSRAELLATVKEINRDIKKFRHHHNTDDNDGMDSFLTFFAGFGGIVAIISLSSAGWLIAPRYLIWNSVLSSSGTISNSMANQRGLSWEMIQDAFLGLY